MEACTLDGYPVAGLARHLQIKWLNTLIVDDGSVYLGIGDTPYPIEWHEFEIHRGCGGSFCLSKP